MPHKSGFVNIIGNPNAGKSTLMNTLLGEKLSIITPKAQTTRHRILGILNEPDYQIVFSDTPGILKPHYKLQESMLKAATSALEDADILLFVIDVMQKTEIEGLFVEKVVNLDVPVIVLINKIDLSTQEKVMETINKWHEVLPKAQIMAISALRNFNVDSLKKIILELLPESPAYFSKDDISDRSERFFISEMIREKILLYYSKEIPYSVEVEIEEFTEEANLVRMRAVIYVERDSQKGIVIGHKGVALKKIGTLARADIEKFLNKQVFLEMYVKVDKDWRDKDRSLKKFGYEK